MNNWFYYLVLLAITLGLGYLTFLLFAPFITPIAWGIILSLVFYPVYVFIQKHIKSPTLSSIITLLIIVLTILGPVSYISIMLVQEITSIALEIRDGKMDFFVDLMQHPKLYSSFEKILSFFHMNAQEFEKKLEEAIINLSKEILSRVTKSVGNVIGFVVDFVFMTFSIFFILKDGKTFLSNISEYLPFSPTQKEKLIIQFKDIVVSTVYGGISVAVLQGILTGITLAFLGFKSPVLWGFVTSVVSFVPLLGAAVVWGPAAIYLFIKGSIIKGVILTIVGIFGISMIDNILKPIIIGSKTKLPVIVIFFSVLGGLGLFGLIGLVAGPLVVVLFFSVIQMVKDLYYEPYKKTNKPSQ
ncbi:MAG: AI-2E family transporter [Thermodesulfovibrionales bacterium]|nr:AI-2E family transporter [Thermodesulfovibrionales bacterium]